MHPILLQFGFFKIFTYGLMVATGFLVAITLAVRQGEKEGFDREQLLDLSFYILVSAILGARLLYVIVEYKYFLRHPLGVFTFWKGGLVFYGGLLCAVSVSIVYLRLHRLPMWRIGDVYAPYIALGHSIGRWGCYFSGSCYGKKTSLPWGITFTDPNSLAPLNIPLHPTQLYDSFNAFSIFLILLWLRKRKSFDGQLFWTYGMLYSVGRFIVEIFRGDDRGFAVEGVLSTSQFIGIGTLTLSAIMWFVLRQKADA